MLRAVNVESDSILLSVVVGIYLVCGQGSSLDTVPLDLYNRN